MTIPVPHPSRRAWLIVALLWFTVLFNYVVRFLPTTMHGSLVAAMPMTEAQYGLLTSLLFWTYAAMSPFAGFLADRLGRSRVIIASLASWSAITCLSAYARTFHELLALRSLLGVVEASYYPAALALICDYHQGATRSLATSLHQTGYIVGVALSGLGGWLAEVRSWHFAFSVVGLAGLAYAVPMTLLLRDAPQPRAAAAPAMARPAVRFGPALAHLFTNRSFILAFINMGILGVSGYTILAWISVFMQERFHLTQGMAGLAGTGPMNAASIPGLLIGGIWADRWARSNRRARMLVPAIGMLLSIPGFWLASHSNVFKLSILGLILFRLVGSFFDANMMPILCEVVDARYRATGYGLLNMIAMGAAGAAIFITGILRDHRIALQTIFDVVPIILFAAALILLGMKPRPPDPAAAGAAAAARGAK